MEENKKAIWGLSPLSKGGDYFVEAGEGEKLKKDHEPKVKRLDRGQYCIEKIQFFGRC